MKKKLKTYELKINVEDGAIVDAIAMVESPAIESNFLAFKKEYKYEDFATNDDKMELIGLAMIPNQEIFRRDDSTGEEYNVFFSSDTIRSIAQQYFKLGFQSNMNIGHTTTPAKSFIFQSYITDKSKGISAPKGIDAPDGAWVIGVKVEDSEVWQEIKAGKVLGFSIEGIFEFINTKFLKQEQVDDEQELINYINLIKIITKQQKQKNEHSKRINEHA